MSRSAITLLLTALTSERMAQRSFGSSAQCYIAPSRGEIIDRIHSLIKTSSEWPTIDNFFKNTSKGTPNIKSGHLTEYLFI